ncbi:MAG: hypothetical protein JXQ27_08830 [Acidobacteria bacterium]|nr:hypothetical protein [Acidobacteriota bacterium]
MRWISLLILSALALSGICGQDQDTPKNLAPPAKALAVKRRATVVNQALVVLKTSIEPGADSQRKLVDLAIKKKGHTGPYAAGDCTNRDVVEAARAYGRSHVPQQLRYRFAFSPPRHHRAATVSSTHQTWSALQRYFKLQRGSEAYRHLRDINRQTMPPMRTGIGSGPPAVPRRYIR